MKRRSELKMKWNNLFSDRCPKCKMPISYKKDSQLFECDLYNEEAGIFSCDFSISPVRLQDLKEKMKATKDLRQFEHDNLEALNNLVI